MKIITYISFIYINNQWKDVQEGNTQGHPWNGLNKGSSEKETS